MIGTMMIGRRRLLTLLGNGCICPTLALGTVAGSRNADAAEVVRWGITPWHCRSS